MTGVLEGYTEADHLGVWPAELFDSVINGYVETQNLRGIRAVEFFQLAFIPEVEDNDPPAVAFITSISEIGPNQEIVIQVTDDLSAFRRIILMVHFTYSGVVESVHDGDGFEPLYVAQSTRVPISGGFEYTVKRKGGWPQVPGIQTFMKWKVFAIDTTGNEG